MPPPLSEQHPSTWPESLPLTLAGAAEHIRADSLARVVEYGPSDPIATWLWNLAGRIEKKEPAELGKATGGWSGTRVDRTLMRSRDSRPNRANNGRTPVRHQRGTSARGSGSRVSAHRPGPHSS